MCTAVLSLILAFMLQGCSSVPEPEPQFKFYELSEAGPLDLSLLPPPTKVMVDGEPMYAFTADQFADLDAWTEGQVEITEQLLLERQHLLNAAKASEQRLVNRVEELNQERQEHTLDVWFYRVALVVVTVGLAL